MIRASIATLYSTTVFVPQRGLLMFKQCHFYSRNIQNTLQGVVRRLRRWLNRADSENTSSTGKGWSLSYPFRPLVGKVKVIFHRHCETRAITIGSYSTSFFSSFSSHHEAYAWPMLRCSKFLFGVCCHQNVSPRGNLKIREVFQALLGECLDSVAKISARKAKGYELSLCL